MNEREVFDVIIELTEEIAAKLRKNRLKCGGVVVGIRDADLSCREYQEKFEHPTQLARDIRLAAAAVFRKKHIWHGNIRSVTVRAIYLCDENTPEQVDMFADVGREKCLLSLETAVDRLRERYGEHAVSSASYLCATKLGSQRIGFRDNSQIY